MATRSRAAFIGVAVYLTWKSKGVVDLFGRKGGFRCLKFRANVCCTTGLKTTGQHVKPSVRATAVKDASTLCSISARLFACESPMRPRAVGCPHEVVLPPQLPAPAKYS